MADPGPDLNRHLVPVAAMLARTLGAEAVFILAIHQTGSDECMVSCGGAAALDVTDLVVARLAAEFMAGIVAEIEAGLPWLSDDPRVTG